MRRWFALGCQRKDNIDAVAASIQSAVGTRLGQRQDGLQPRWAVNRPMGDGLVDAA